MGMKHEYWCDICREDFEPDGLIGLRFVGNTVFKLSDAKSTDGKHICYTCLNLIVAQAKDIIVPDDIVEWVQHALENL